MSKKEQKEHLLAQYSDWLLMRNYSKQTYKSYMGSVRNFWKYCEAKSENPKFDKSNAVQSFLAYRLSVKKLNFSTVNGDYSASHPLAVHSLQGLPDLAPSGSFAHNGFTSMY